ncbi:MAG: hypothetical protein E7653_07135 [Ruminococcaceae bacterium]|nr:hypothetical protein [Oscillospiraceae bacterium]
MIKAMLKYLFGGIMSHIKKRRAHSALGKAARLFLIALFISFGGWCFEVVGRALVYRQIADRGFLSLPLCPIYGISIVLIYLLVGVPSRLSGLIGGRVARSKVWRFMAENKYARIISYFAFVTFVSTAVELLTGLLARSLGAPLWNYSERAFNLLGIICLGYSLLWGALITLFMCFLWGPIYLLVSKLPNDASIALSVWAAIPVSLDFFINVLYLLVTGQRL